MIDPALDEVTTERARSLDVDWRGAWVGPDAGGELRAWPASVAEAMGVPGCEPAPTLELTSMLEPMRSAPAHASEMISELRGGERVQGIVQRDAWWLVAGEDGYVGWMHEWVLRETAESPTEPSWLYSRALGTLWLSDHHAAIPLVLGTPLWRVDGPLPERGGFHLLRTSTGEEGWVPQTELWPAVREVTPRDAMNFGKSLVGTPYRWGGRSPLGFDCSGFVQYVATLSGARIPRDASQQSRVGEQVDLQADVWEMGDLLFFGDPADHVALTDGRGRILHCQGRVRQDRIDRRPDLMERLTAVRRWWGLRHTSALGAWSFRDQ